MEYCSVPVVSAQQRVENEMSNFQEKLNRALMVCQDKFETAKSQQHNKPNIMADLESCVDLSIRDSISTLPYLALSLMSSFNNNN